MIAKDLSVLAVGALVGAIAVVSWSGVKQMSFRSPPSLQVEQADKPLIPLYEIRRQRLENWLKKRRHRI